MDQTIVKKRVVGVDVSLDKTTYAIVDVRGNILAKDSFPTLDYPEINGFVPMLCERIVEVVENNVGYESIRSVGVSAPSANFLTGCIVNAPNLAAMIRDPCSDGCSPSHPPRLPALRKKEACP